MLFWSGCCCSKSHKDLEANGVASFPTLLEYDSDMRPYDSPPKPRRESSGLSTRENSVPSAGRETPSMFRTQLLSVEAMFAFLDQPDANSACEEQAVVGGEPSMNEAEQGTHTVSDENAETSAETPGNNMDPRKNEGLQKAAPVVEDAKTRGTGECKNTEGTRPRKCSKEKGNRSCSKESDIEGKRSGSKVSRGNSKESAKGNNASSALTMEERARVWTAMSREDRLKNGDALVDAAKHGEIEKIRRLIGQGVKVDASNSQGRCALRCAAKHGQTKLVKILIEEFGARVNAQNTFNNETALHLACKFNHESTVKLLVGFGADSTMKNNHGQTAVDLLRSGNPGLVQWVESHTIKTESNHEFLQKAGGLLVEAATSGDIETVRRLVSEGIGVDTENSEGSCALRRAARFGHTKFIEAILTEFDANLNGRNRHNRETALHFACKYNRAETVKFLVEFGADCTLRNKVGALASELLSKRNPELAKWVANFKHASAGKRRSSFRDECVNAASAGDLEAIRRLVSQGCDVDAVDSEGDCALRRAAKAGHTALVRTLLSEFHAHVNAHNRHNHETALHVACKQNKEDVIRILIEFGADSDLQNKAGAVASDLLQKKNPELAEWIRNRSGEHAVEDSTDLGDSLVQAAIKCDIDSIRALYGRGINVDTEDADGRCAIRTAARDGHTHVVSILVTQLGSDINSRNQFHGETALHLACRFNREVAIQFLVEHGAQLHIKNRKGETPFDILKGKNPELAKWLHHYDEEHHKGSGDSFPS